MGKEEGLRVKREGYRKRGERRRERQRGRERDSICRFTSQIFSNSQAEARNLLKVSHMGVSEPNTWVILCCFPRHIQLSYSW